MNLFGHFIIGAAGYAITNEPLFFVGSIIPDVVLIPNELKSQTFNKWDVRFKSAYDLTHSLFAPIVVWFLSPSMAIAWFLHIVIDIPFHTSSFRWKPFLLNRYQSKKKALLLSGGADSILCAIKERGYDAYFFDYGQTYMEAERICAEQFAAKNGIKLNIITKEWFNDIEDRNVMMIEELVRRGYDEIIIGTRNIFPLFDKYGDSNWWRLKKEQWRLGAYVNMPVVGMFKWQIIKQIKDYQFYSTE